MTYTIRLCGGPGESQVIQLLGHAVDVYRFAVVRPVTPIAYYAGEDENNLPTPGVVCDVVRYYDTGICAADGMRLYATAELLAELHAAAARPQPEMPAWVGSVIEGMLPRSCWEAANPPFSGPSIIAGTSGKREYPWDAIKREDTERLLAKIDEVTDAES